MTCGFDPDHTHNQLKLHCVKTQTFAIVCNCFSSSWLIKQHNDSRPRDVGWMCMGCFVSYPRSGAQLSPRGPARILPGSSASTARVSVNSTVTCLPVPVTPSQTSHCTLHHLRNPPMKTWSSAGTRSRIRSSVWRDNGATINRVIASKPNQRGARNLTITDHNTRRSHTHRLQIITDRQ